ncbi:MAG: zinc-ribbon domain-containing protein [Anaerolineae bacterium]|nr:zinc-ribbon domain-containing protein [Anaerolineae bacterium]
MIIFGTRVRHKHIGEGEFFCPKCQANRRYAHKQAVRSFTLYFIPIFPIQQLGEFIECQTCGVTLEPAARQTRQKPAARLPSAQQDLGSMMNSIKSRLDKGFPVEHMIRELTAANLDLEIARGAVQGAIGKNVKVCEKCNLAYSPAAGQCAECGRELR